MDHPVIPLLEELGGLHDSTILGLHWSPEKRQLVIEIEDIYSNFEGLPEYRSPQPASFVFFDVDRFDLVDLNLAEEGLMIYEC